MGTHDIWVPMKFIFGKPTDEPFDRENEVRLLTDLINRKQPTAIIGIRRIGKTSIILKTLKNISLPKIYITTEDFVNGKSFDLQSFLAYYSSQVLSQLIVALENRKNSPLQIVKIKGKEILEKLRDLIGYVKIKFNLPLGDIEALIEGRNLKESVRNIIDLPQTLGENFDLNFVIIIDEFQYLKLASQSYPGIFHLIRSRWQFHDRISYVISGSSVGLLEKIFTDKEEPFYQFFYPVIVKPFSEEQSKEFLRQGYFEENKEFSEEALEIVVKEIDGIPAWLNYFGLKTLQCNKITSECAKNMLVEMFNDPIVRSIVEQEYNKLSKNAREIMKFLAMKGGRGNLRGINLKKSSKNEGLKSLISEGYLTREERGIYAITDPVISKVLSLMN